MSNANVSAIAVAADVWNQRGVDLIEVERFIHDDHPMDDLVGRGAGLVGLVQSHFPWAAPKPGAVVLEIGSGVGYPLQAALAAFNPSRIIGLDIADGMIAQAKARLTRDGITDPRIEFLHYDGITIPLPDNSVDFIYSLAALQHVPRLGVYNLLFEIKRVLKPGGYCSAQTLAFSLFKMMPKEQRRAIFEGQTRSQLANKSFGWVTYYSFDELLYVLSEGVEVSDIHLVEKDGSIWFSFCKSGEKTFHFPWLPRLCHENVRPLYEGL
jgi:SAM-dependent methyltransferase